MLAEDIPPRIHVRANRPRPSEERQAVAADANASEFATWCAASSSVCQTESVHVSCFIHGDLNTQRVPHKGFVFDDLKTKASKAPLELTLGQIAMLREHRRRLMKERLVAGSEWTELDLVFPTGHGGPLDSSGVRRHCHRVCAKAGVRPRRIHDWRVTTASWLADLNVHADTAKQILRHSQSSTTMEYYTRSSSATLRAAIEALDQLFNE